MRPTYENLTLIGSGPIVTGWTGNNRHFLETLFEVPRNMSTKTSREVM